MNLRAPTVGIALLGAALLALMPGPATSLDCRLINCDCDRISAGLLTGPYKKECGKKEAIVKANCAAGKPAGVCDPVARGPDAFPLATADARPSIDARTDRYVRGFEKLRPPQRIRYFRLIAPELQALAADAPELALAAAVGQATTDAEDASIQAGRALSDLKPNNVGAVPPERARRAAVTMTRASAALDRSGPENPAGLYRLAKAAERLGAAGIGTAELAGNDPGTMKTLEKAAKWAKAGLDMNELAQRGEVDAKRFVGDMLSLVPKSASPVLDAPAGKFFRDLMDWNQRMWTSTTDGLDVVTRAIETGKLDTQDYARVSGDLQALAKDGPWTMRSGIDFVKKTAEEIPVVGKLLKALWG